MPQTPAKGASAAGRRVGHGRGLAGPVRRGSCARPGLRRLPIRNAAAALASAGSTTGGASNASLPADASTAPLNAQTHVNDCAPAEGTAVMPHGNGRASAETATAGGASAKAAAKSGTPSPARRKRSRAAFPSVLISSRSTSPAIGAAPTQQPGSGNAAPDTSQPGQALLESAGVLGDSGGLPAMPAQDELLGNATGDLTSEPDTEGEDVDIVGWGPQTDPPQATAQEDPLFVQTNVAIERAVAASGKGSGVSGAELADELANGAARNADAIGDLTSDDMRIFENAAAGSVAHVEPNQDAQGAADEVAPDQAAQGTTDQDATAVPNQDAARAPKQAASKPPPSLPARPARPAVSAQAALPNHSSLAHFVLEAEAARAASLEPVPGSGAAASMAACQVSSGGGQPFQSAPDAAAAADSSTGDGCPATAEGASIAGPSAAAAASINGAALASVVGTAAMDAVAESDHMGEAAQHDFRDKSGDVSSKEVDIEISLSLDDT